MIRIRSITLSNFMNVGHGEIDFSDSVSGSCILGIYGQNGSGKTAVINALELFRRLATGSSISKTCQDCIASESDSLEVSVTVEFSGEEAISDDNLKMDFVTYTFKAGRCSENKHDENVELLSEKVSAKFGQERIRVIASWQREISKSHKLGKSLPWEQYATSLKPSSNWDPFFSANKDAKLSLAMGAFSSLKEGRSFLFSHELATLLRTTIDARSESRKNLEPNALGPDSAVALSAGAFLGVIPQLFEYARSNLVVLATSQSAYTSLGVMPLASSERSEHSLAMGVVGDIIVSTSNPVPLPNEEVKELTAVIDTMNKVLPSLVPGLTVKLKELSPETLDDGRLGTRVEILSIRNGRPLPIRTESEGIRKIIAILGLLIQVHGNANATAAIDELDSGLFEFLLGEIIEVFRDSAKGQLIFTAHNLRPLECLSPNSLVFTTTNPQNRYIKFSGIKKSHNLRDRYLRAINLGGQSETVYDPTDKISISTAFFKANHDLSLENETIDEILSQIGDLDV